MADKQAAQYRDYYFGIMEQAEAQHREELQLRKEQYDRRLSRLQEKLRVADEKAIFMEDERDTMLNDKTLLETRLTKAKQQAEDFRQTVKSMMALTDPGFDVDDNEEGGEYYEEEDEEEYGEEEKRTTRRTRIRTMRRQSRERFILPRRRRWERKLPAVRTGRPRPPRSPPQ